MNKKYLFTLLGVCFLLVIGFVLYSNINKNESVTDTSNLTSVEVLNNNVDLGRIERHKKQDVSFRIRNKGNALLLIQSVEPSCGCTNVEYDDKPIPIGKIGLITLEYDAASIGFFNKTARVICNSEEPIMLRIIGEVISKE